MVLTFDKKLLDKGENYGLNLYGTTWLHESYRHIWTKSKICSLIISNKKLTSGHKLRHIIVELIQKQSINFIDIYNPMVGVEDIVFTENEIKNGNNQKN